MLTLHNQTHVSAGNLQWPLHAPVHFAQKHGICQYMQSTSHFQHRNPHLLAMYLSVGEKAAFLGLTAICGSFCIDLTPSCST